MTRDDSMVAICEIVFETMLLNLPTVRSRDDLLKPARGQERMFPAKDARATYRLVCNLQLGAGPVRFFFLHCLSRSKSSSSSLERRQRDIATPEWLGASD